MVIGPAPKCITEKCLHWTDPLNCSVYKKIPDGILMGAKCEHFVSTLNYLERYVWKALKK
jgi:hypothetical protein